VFGGVVEQDGETGLDIAGHTLDDFRGGEVLLI